MRSCDQVDDRAAGSLRDFCHSKRYFLGNDDKVYKWKVVKGIGSVVRELSSWCTPGPEGSITQNDGSLHVPRLAKRLLALRRTSLWKASSGTRRNGT